LVVILLLLAVWGGVGAWWYLSRPESRSTDSIGSFRHQLRVLERTGPVTVSPAYRMESRDLGVYGASQIPTMSRSVQLMAGTPSVVAARRRRVQKRRRDVFFGLTVSVIGAAALGFLPGLAVMWGLAALLAVGLALYVVMLAQVTTATTERTQKVRYLHAAPAPRGRQGWVAEPEPAYLLRRSAN
jgi:hypothetical protein